MSAAILTTGTELMRGELVNGNSAWLADALSELGFEVAAIDSVGDDAPSLRAALERLGWSHDVLVCTGGLGPTTDDLTTKIVAETLGVPLVRDEASLEVIRKLLERAGRSMAISNAKQADFPRGATILPNARGTAPGFTVRLGSSLAFFLPGVPSEMKAMFGASVTPALVTLPRTPQHQVRLRTYGLPESTINDRLKGIETQTGVVIGYRATLPEIEVKLLARGDDAERRARAAASEARERLGDAVYGEGQTTFAAALLELFEARASTLSLAESCTGGLVAELLTGVPGASRTFLGGVVAYANQAKSALLGVDPALLATHGAVSDEVARAMAEGARTRFGSDLALGVTGIAGPDGGTADKPVGLVYIAVAGATGTQTKELRLGGGRDDVRRRAAFAGLALLRRALSSQLEPDPKP